MNTVCELRKNTDNKIPSKRNINDEKKKKEKKIQ